MNSFAFRCNLIESTNKKNQINQFNQFEPGFDLFVKQFRLRKKCKNSTMFFCFAVLESNSFGTLSPIATWNCHRHIIAIPPAVPTLQIWGPPADCRNLDRPSGPAFYLSDPCKLFPAAKRLVFIAKQR